MTSTFGRGIAASLVLVAIAASSSGCRAEYRGHDSGIDGALWRQVASFEDPLSRQLYDPLEQDVLANDPATYLAVLDGARWDGADSSAEQLDLARGGVVLYDETSTESAAEVSVFIASGPRPEVLTDDGWQYSGPRTVFTCYRVRAEFGHRFVVERTEFDACPAALVEQLPADAAFASAEVFDG